jgi:hypothetical protein
LAQGHRSLSKRRLGRLSFPPHRRSRRAPPRPVPCTRPRSRPGRFRHRRRTCSNNSGRPETPRTHPSARPRRLLSPFHTRPRKSPSRGPQRKAARSQLGKPEYPGRRSCYRRARGPPARTALVLARERCAPRRTQPERTRSASKPLQQHANVARWLSGVAEARPSHKPGYCNSSEAAGRTPSNRPPTGYHTVGRALDLLDIDGRWGPAAGGTARFRRSAARIPRPAIPQGPGRGMHCL